MCGIFGVVATSESELNQKDLKKLILSFFKLSERRGKDASGVIGIGAELFEVYKSPIRARKMIKTKYFNNILDNALKGYDKGESICFSGHTRMVTGGSESDSYNNQPVLKDKMALLHNGIIVNEDILWSRNTHLKRAFEVDSEILLSLISHRESINQDLLRSFKDSISEVKGANTFALFHKNDDFIYLNSSNRSLYFYSTDNGLAIFSSEKHVLTESIKSVTKYDRQTGSKLTHADPSSIYRIDMRNASLQKYFTESVSKSNKEHTRKKKREIKDLTPLIKQKSFTILGNQLTKIKQELKLNTQNILNLKRCNHCVLPETFPNITFNSEGICQFCISFEREALIGLDKLFETSKNIRSSHKEDCLIPLSGGRDSCYALHFVKEELGLNPVAFTYDWGFVTDQARRNISRICGELNVEHILVAADIRRKRQNVKKNVSAWLSKPNVSMVPLFMAGDKFFYKYATILKKEMKLSSIIFSQNALEMTNFKTGFANVDDTAKHKKLHGLSASNQLRLIIHYIKNFLSNPKYINDTLADTAWAYMYYYMKERDYLLLFDYIEWEEEKIISTIKDKYNWEGSLEGNSTWRIGDGTAPFYNYIYLKHSGFCENDTFRSNQIRAGLLDRKTALEFVFKENVIGAESLKWYCDKIDIDAQSALRVINSTFKKF